MFHLHNTFKRIQTFLCVAGCPTRVYPAYRPCSGWDAGGAHCPTIYCSHVTMRYSRPAQQTSSRVLSRLIQATLKGKGGAAQCQLGESNKTVIHYAWIYRLTSTLVVVAHRISPFYRCVNREGGGWNERMGGHRGNKEREYKNNVWLRMINSTDGWMVRVRGGVECVISPVQVIKI